MGLGVLLVPAIGGYWFLTHLHYTRYQAVRDSGYHVLFRSAFCGSVLFVVSEVIILLLGWQFPHVLEELDTIFSIAYSDTAALSVILGVTLPLLGNRIYGTNRAVQKIARDAGTWIELLIAESVEDQKLVELSLKSGKSYIGFATESGSGAFGNNDISVIPVASGYRERETQELRITINYVPVITQLLERSPEIALEDFRVVIPISEIVSARPFIIEAYELFQQQGR